MTPSDLRRPLLAGNWKMHKTLAEAVDLARKIREGAAGVGTVDVAVAPPFTALAAVAQALAGSDVGLAAQDVFWEAQGAYTGAISPLMLKDVGCRYVIVGHSERRQYFEETDATVNRKLKAALEVELIPIFCLGETLAEREAGQTLARVGTQLENGLQGLDPEKLKSLVVAYEPVWAIGTGRTASPAQAQEVHAFIRTKLMEAWGKETAERLRILYGGSVTPDNIATLISEPDIDGALVGGASLKAETVLNIVRLGR